MTSHYGPVGDFPASRSHLGSGMEILEQWADSAGQVAKNAMYKALFSVLDGTVAHSYEIVDHYGRPREFTVKVRDDLVVRVCVQDTGMFGISSIGGS